MSCRPTISTSLYCTMTNRNSTRQEHADGVNRLRPYFLVGDILSSVGVGVFTGLVCSALIEPGWYMLPAMLACMVLGMVLALLLGVLVFYRYFGAMEVIVPTMFTGMFAGMAVGMMAAVTAVEWPLAAGLGALIGLVTLAATYAANSMISGRIVS